MGRNVAPRYFTKEVVDMTPFTDRFSVLQDVPIVGGATQVQLPDGAMNILDIHQGL